MSNSAHLRLVNPGIGADEEIIDIMEVIRDSAPPAPPIGTKGRGPDGPNGFGMVIGAILGGLVISAGCGFLAFKIDSTIHGGN